MTAPDQASHQTPASRRRVIRLTLLILAIAVLTALALSLQLSGR